MKGNICWKKVLGQQKRYKAHYSVPVSLFFRSNSKKIFLVTLETWFKEHKMCSWVYICQKIGKNLVKTEP